MAEQNLRITLRERPTGAVSMDHFTLERVPVPALDDGQVLVKTRYLSLDPAMRGWLNDVRSYVPPVGLGEVMRAQGIGEVIESKHAERPVGSLVLANMGWQSHYVAAGAMVQPLEAGDLPPQTYLAALGMPGMTAYFGLLDVGKPEQGQTVLVSGAAGAVGSVVGQIAKLEGCRAVGIAGGPDKCAVVVDELGFDACIDYKNEPSLSKAIRRTCPDGVHVYFDNVGGETLNTALRRMALRGRIVICGAISTYNATTPQPGPSNYMALLVNRARMEGFVVFDYAARFPEARERMAQWIRDGKLISREHVIHGLEHAVDGLNMLFSGGNTGKLILEV
jgi:NADPH-dependent curcumin reductase CurA